MSSIYEFYYYARAWISSSAVHALSLSLTLSASLALSLTLSLSLALSLAFIFIEKIPHSVLLIAVVSVSNSAII